MAEIGSAAAVSKDPNGRAAGPAGARTANEERLRVFISYSREDAGFADQLDAALDACGFDCSIDRLGISGGEDWKARLTALIGQSDTVVFVLSPASARSEICAWEVGESARLGKRILPVVCRPLEDAKAPEKLHALNYVYFCPVSTVPGSGFGEGLKLLATALNTDFDWMRAHTRYLQRAREWDQVGRPSTRLLTGSDITEAKAWAGQRPKTAPEPTALQLEFIRASEEEANRRSNAERRRLEALREAVQQQEAAVKRRARTQKVAIVLAIAVGIFGLAAGFFYLEAKRYLDQSLQIVAGVQTKITAPTQKDAVNMFKDAASWFCFNGAPPWLCDSPLVGYVGVAYRNGWGVEKNVSFAKEQLGRAAAYGDTNAMDNLAALYESGEADERGIPDYVQAIAWYTKAAEAGDREAMNNLGRLYYTAGGVEKDLEAASRWFRAAAGIPKDKPDCRSMETRGNGDLSGGVPDALFNLGRVSDDRERGGDPAAAAETRCWYEMAADTGHADAMVKLGSIYETGRGVESNVATAVEWYEKAAKSNNKEAMFSLGSLYETGLGVPRDMGSALIWYARAAAQDATAELDPAELHNRYVLGSIVKLGALFQEGFREAPNLATADDWYEKAERMRESARAHARSLTPSPEVTTPKL